MKNPPSGDCGFLPIASVELISCWSGLKSGFAITMSDPPDHQRPWLRVLKVEVALIFFPPSYRGYAAEGRKSKSSI